MLDELSVAGRLEREATASVNTSENLCTDLLRYARLPTESIINIESSVTSLAVLKDDDLIAGPGCCLGQTIVGTPVTGGIVAVITLLVAF